MASTKSQGSFSSPMIVLVSPLALRESQSRHRLVEGFESLLAHDGRRMAPAGRGQRHGMSKPIHVLPRLGRWAVVPEDSDEPLAEFDEHEQAESWARRNA